MIGEWVQFGNLETKHFFERFGEVLAERSICNRVSIYSGPMVKVWNIKQRSKPQCRACNSSLAARVRAIAKKSEQIAKEQQAIDEMDEAILKHTEGAMQEEYESQKEDF